MHAERKARAIGNAGVMLAVIGAIFPVLAPDLDVRWPLAAGLFLAGAICLCLSRWMLGKLQ
jgi:hypothetical protein